MSNLQVKNIPEPVHAELRRLARLRGTSIREIVLDAIEQRLARERFRASLSGRRRVDLGEPAARFLDEARDEREPAVRR